MTAAVLRLPVTTELQFHIITVTAPGFDEHQQHHQGAHLSIHFRRHLWDQLYFPKPAVWVIVLPQTYLSRKESGTTGGENKPSTSH